MPANDVYTATLLWVQDNVRYVNVLHFEQTNADSGTSPLIELAHAVYEVVHTDLMPLMANNVQLEEIVTRRIAPTLSQSHAFVVLEFGTGFLYGMPAQTNQVTTFYTNSFTKRGRGRFRLSGLGKDAVTNTNIESSLVDSLVVFWDAVLAGITWTGGAINFAARVWSKVDQLARTITHYKVHTNPRKLRSRRK